MLDSMKMISEAADRRHVLAHQAEAERMARLASGEISQPRASIASRMRSYWHVLTHLNKVRIKIIVDYGDVVPDTAR